MSTSQKKVLVAVDFSEQSHVALGQAYNLSKQIGAEIVLLHVIDDSGFVANFLSPEQKEQMKKHAQQELDKLVAEAKNETSFAIETMIGYGTAYDKISEVAEMLNAVFIVMGCNGAEGLKRKLLGSNTVKVVKQSAVPVISIKGKHHRQGCSNIVLPLDLTKETKEKVSKALWLSNLYNGAVIRVVSVLFTTDEFILNRLVRQLGQVKTFIDKAGVKCTAELIKGRKSEGNLAHYVVDYSKRVEGDLIMIMTQQEVEFTPYFIGSSAQEIITNSDIPVLSIIPTIKKDTSVFTPY
jgi:nucleotide-binding universal stress UspA family protein